MRDVTVIRSAIDYPGSGVFPRAVCVIPRAARLPG
jgi:hypothetical protein